MKLRLWNVFGQSRGLDVSGVVPATSAGEALLLAREEDDALDDATGTGGVEYTRAELADICLRCGHALCPHCEYRWCDILDCVCSEVHNHDCIRGTQEEGDEIFPRILRREPGIDHDGNEHSLVFVIARPIDGPFSPNELQRLVSSAAHVAGNDPAHGEFLSPDEVRVAHVLRRRKN